MTYAYQTDTFSMNNEEVYCHEAWHGDMSQENVDKLLQGKDNSYLIYRHAGQCVFAHNSAQGIEHHVFRYIEGRGFRNGGNQIYPSLMALIADYMGCKENECIAIKR